MSEQSTFATRLLELIGEANRSAFARKSGISETSIRQYLAGTMPGIDKAMQIADAADVEPLWLIAGRGPKDRSQSQSMSGGQAPLDAELLREIVEIVENALSAQKKSLPPAKKAELIAESYSFCMDEAALTGAGAKDMAPRVLGRFLKLVA